ncbi:hypothetical protein GCT19_41385 [Paraburkholderia sp. CNPSo 3155]|nr:hypothetical protein [Paraburkholderia atlantica]
MKDRGNKMTFPFSLNRRMPHKHNAARRHHILKMAHRVTNWPEYEAGLRPADSAGCERFDRAGAHERGWFGEPVRNFVFKA